MRGKEELFHQFLRYDRITPAYAGKRPHGGFFCKSLEDHPRLCGEKQNDKNAKANTTGSPPPMRGKGISNLQKEIQRRITPAYAGKSVAGVAVMALGQDHPRLCGEKLLFSPQEM